MKLLFLIFAVMLTPPLAFAQSAEDSVTIRRASMVVSDLDRALTLWRDVLGMSVHSINPVNKDSLSYDLFNVPQEATMRFANLNSRDRIRAYGLLEVKGIELPPASGIRRIGPLINTHGRWAEIKPQLTEMGITLIREKQLTTAEGALGVETGFVDWDGNLVIVYELE